jgi:hypothetical protein
MLVGLGWVHALLLRLCLWILKLPFQALAGTIKAMLALVGESVQRALSILVSGLLIYLIAKAVLTIPHPPKPALWTVALMAALWFYAFLRAAHYIATNNLIRVRQRLLFRQLAGMEGRLGDRLEGLRDGAFDTMATRARGTPFEGMFGSNRQRRDEEQAEAQATAEQAEADRRAAAAEAAHWTPEQVAERRDKATAEPAAVISKGGYRVA